MTTDDKVLCVCEGGNVRSGTLAYILKMNGIDALTCGTVTNKPETIKMLCDWADKILIADKNNILDKIPKEHLKKVTDMEIGPDIWGQPLTPVLMGICLDKLNKMFKETKKEDENISTDSDNRKSESK